MRPPPIDPTLPAATRPTTSPARQTATLSADDQRLRVMLHDAASVYQPEVVPVRGSLPTLILTAGQGQYTAATLVQYGALVMLPHQAALLLAGQPVGNVHRAGCDLGPLTRDQRLHNWSERSDAGSHEVRRTVLPGRLGGTPHPDLVRAPSPMPPVRRKIDRIIDPTGE